MNFFLILNEAPHNSAEIQKIISLLPRQHSLDLLTFCCPAAAKEPTTPVSFIPAVCQIACCSPTNPTPFIPKLFLNFISYCQSIGHI